MEEYKKYKAKLLKPFKFLFSLPFQQQWLYILGEPIYIMVFGLENSPEIGGVILQWYSLAAVFFALFTVTAAIMQGINKQKKLIIGIILGIFLKIVLNFTLVPYLKEAGPILATYFGFILSILYNIYIIKKTIQYKLSPLLRSLKEVFLLVLTMSLAVYCVKFLTELWLPEVLSLYTRAVVTSIISISAGLLVYLGIGSRLKLVKRFSLKNKLE